MDQQHSKYTLFHKFDHLLSLSNVWEITLTSKSQPWRRMIAIHLSVEFEYVCGLGGGGKDLQPSLFFA